LSINSGMINKDKPAILITGGSGLLGLNWGFQVSNQYNVCFALHQRQIQVSTGQERIVDLGSMDAIRAVMDNIKPCCVVHTAGMTSIEQCEANPELARQVNTEYAVNVASTCMERSVPMIHVSTDNFFDGTASMVNEDHVMNPVNVYGRTKADAENGILDTTADVIIIRTNFYGWGPVYKPSFSDTIISSLRSGKQISLFEDVFYTPILIRALVKSAHDLLAMGKRGVYNLCGDDRLSKYDFGIAIARKFGFDARLISPGKLSDLSHLVRRSVDMSMCNNKASKALGRSIGGVDSHLALLFQEENSPFTKEIRTLDSIR
jgi:dTDP-4-dehydrorhamnose reductase